MSPFSLLTFIFKYVIILYIKKESNIKIRRKNIRWKVKKKPKDTSERTRTTFAFLPTRINDEWIWLEAYRVKEMYHDNNWGVIGYEVI